MSSVFEFCGYLTSKQASSGPW